MGNVHEEVPVEFFIVDILVNNKLVIEVNGNTHHLFNLSSFTKIPNIKTEFRSRILRKLGYTVFDVNLEDYNEGSFEIIDEIYQIVHSMEDKSTYLTPKTKR